LVTDALRAELAALGADVASSTLAESALALARMLDDPETLGTARTAAARELRETLGVLTARAAGRGEDRMTKFERPRAVAG
jgi:hypothetical protein